MKLTRARFLATFFVATAICAGLPTAFVAARGFAPGGAEYRALAIFLSFAPLFGAIVCTAVAPPRAETARSLGLVFAPNRFWLVAWLAPLAATVVALLVGGLLGLDPRLTGRALARSATAEGSPIPPWQLLVMALPAGLLNFIPSLAAEVGYRGFLFRELPGGFFPRATAIAAVEGLVFAPIVALGFGFASGGGLANLVPFSVHVLLTGYVAFVLRARGASVVPVALFRGTQLALVRPLVDLLPEGSAALRAPYGWLSSAGLLVIFLALVVHDAWFAPGRLVTGTLRRPVRSDATDATDAA